MFARERFLWGWKMLSMEVRAEIMLLVGFVGSGFVSLCWRRREEGVAGIFVWDEFVGRRVLDMEEPVRT